MTSRTRRAALLAATLLAGAGTAIAQGTGGAYDPAQMPVVQGKVAQYDLTPRGDVDGLILDDGTEVHFPPHLGAQVVAAVRPGEGVTIHGLKARVLPLVQAISVTGDATGKTVADDASPAPDRRPPPPMPPQAGREMQAQGTIRMQLHGPRGELNGALLDDGTMVHLPPPEASRLAAALRPGEVIAVLGDGVENGLGRAIDAQAVGPSLDKLAQLAAPPPPPGPGPAGGPAAPFPPPPGPLAAPPGGRVPVGPVTAPQ